MFNLIYNHCNKCGKYKESKKIDNYNYCLFCFREIHNKKKFINETIEILYDLDIIKIISPYLLKKNKKHYNNTIIIAGCCGNEYRCDELILFDDDSFICGSCMDSSIRAGFKISESIAKLKIELENLHNFPNVEKECIHKKANDILRNIGRMSIVDEAINESNELDIEISKLKRNLNHTPHQNYGANTQKKMADFAEPSLSTVKSKDLGEVGNLITGLVTDLKSFGKEEKKDVLGSFQKGNLTIII